MVQVAVVAQVGSLAWELPHARGVAKNKQTKKQTHKVLSRDHRPGLAPTKDPGGPGIIKKKGKEYGKHSRGNNEGQKGYLPCTDSDLQMVTKLIFF